MKFQISLRFLPRNRHVAVVRIVLQLRPVRAEHISLKLPCRNLCTVSKLRPLRAEHMTETKEEPKKDAFIVAGMNAPKPLGALDL